MNIFRLLLCLSFYRTNIDIVYSDLTGVITYHYYIEMYYNEIDIFVITNK